MVGKKQRVSYYRCEASQSEKPIRTTQAMDVHYDPKEKPDYCTNNPMFVINTLHYNR